ncbi:MAG: hypothetical protein ACOCRX_09450 [Candidatus Woesearchaeota archaeon]
MGGKQNIEKILKEQMKKFHNNSGDSKYWGNEPLFHSLDVLNRYSCLNDTSAKSYYEHLYNSIKNIYGISEEELQHNIQIYHDTQRRINYYLISRDEN